MDDSELAQRREQLDRAGERPPLRQQLPEDLAVPPLERLGLARPRAARPISRATARANRPPLIPMRRWIRQPSTGSPASSRASCHAKTCAYTVSTPSVPSRSKMSAARPEPTPMPDYSGPVKVLSVVGNRPQFVKSGPLSVALREGGIEEVVLHTGQHWDRELSEVFFEELDLPEPKYRLDLHSSDPGAMEPGIAARARGGAAGRGARLRRHELDARRRPRGRHRRRAGRPRRGRAAQRRPLDARGAEPDRGRPRRRPAALPGRALPRHAASARRPAGTIEVVGDVMADALLPARADRARPLARARALRRRARPLPARDGAPRGERAPRADRAHRRRPEPARGADRLPGPPAHARACCRRSGRTSASPSRSATSTWPRSPRRRGWSSPTRAACRRRRTGTASRA